ncbi:zinc finger, CCHC-type containing protein [Tanacetum coccineum]
MGILYKSMELQNKLGSNNLVLVLKQDSMEYKIKKIVFGLRWNCNDCEAEVFHVCNDDTAMAQRRLEDKQPEEKINTDCLVKERENVHLGIKVGENITVTGVPGQEGVKGNHIKVSFSDTIAVWMSVPSKDPFLQVETTCGSLVYELQSDTRRDKMLLELERECLEVYTRKVDLANKSRAQIRQMIADSETELAAICSASIPEPPKELAIRILYLLTAANMLLIICRIRTLFA